MKNRISRVRLAVISLTGLLAVASALVYTTFSSSPGYIAEFAANSAGNAQINSTAGTTPWDALPHLKSNLTGRLPHQ